MEINQTLKWHICLVTAVILMAVSAACSQHRPDSRLTEVAARIAANPTDAVARLDSIDRGSLSATDRHLHDFLTVKARDKAYIRHTSDSLIRSVIDWYEHNDDPAVYSEALYYAGRVYSDLGDLNTALRYFHLALDRLPEDTPDQNLRCNALSQTGRLLDKLRLHSEAIPYLHLTLRADSLLRDTFAMAYDSQLLGSVYLGLDSFALADHFLTRAYEAARHLSDPDLANMQGFLAIARAKEGRADDALRLIRNVPERVALSEKDYFTSWASQIYYQAGIMDTAYIYADRVRMSEDAAYRANAYACILSPEIRSRVAPDSIIAFTDYYLECVNLLKDNTQNEAVALQNAIYNYSIHRERNNHLSSSLRTTRAVYGTTIIILIFLLFCLVIVHLHKRIKKAELTLVRENLSDLHNQHAETVEEIISPKSVGELKNDIILLIDELKKRSETVNNNPLSEVSEDSLPIRKIIAARTDISHNDEDWKTLIAFISAKSPNFFSFVTRLNPKETLTDKQLKIIILMRLGVTNNAISDLLNVAPATITYQRRKICEILFHNHLKVDDMENAIRAI